MNLAATIRFKNLFFSLIKQDEKQSQGRVLQTHKNKIRKSFNQLSYTSLKQNPKKFERLALHTVRTISKAVFRRDITKEDHKQTQKSCLTHTGKTTPDKLQRIFLYSAQTTSENVSRTSFTHCPNNINSCVRKEYYQTRSKTVSKSCLTHTGKTTPEKVSINFPVQCSNNNRRRFKD